MLTVSTVFGFPQNFASRLTITASFWQVHASRVIKRYEATLPFQFFKNIRGQNKCRKSAITGKLLSLSD